MNFLKRLFTPKPKPVDVFSPAYREKMIREAIEAGASEYFLQGMGVGFAEIDRIRKETGYNGEAK